MATPTQPTLADIQEKARALTAQIQASPVDASDKKAIAGHAKTLLTLVEQTIPHINTAQNAFGGQEEALNQATALKNRLAKVIAAYGG